MLLRGSYIIDHEQKLIFFFFFKLAFKCMEEVLKP